MSEPAGQESAVVKPSDCLLAFGIPTSHRDFRLACERNDNGFVKFFHEVWERYEQQIIVPIAKSVPVLQSLGVEIRDRIDAPTFGDLFSRSQRKVIILFSHWDDDRVEFSDGFATIGEIVERIPRHCDKFIDLCVCHPVSLRLAIKNRCSNCTIRYTDKSATPYLWLEFYWALFRHLARKQLSYTQALEEVAITLLNTRVN